MYTSVNCFMLTGLICLGFGKGAGPKAGAQLEKESPVVEYVYQQDLNRRVGRIQDNIVYVGRLDTNGNFIKGKGEFLYPGVGLSSIDFFTFCRLYMSLSQVTVINLSRGPVYEFRSGKLIKGVLNAEGNFVPDAGSKLLPFKDYPYGEAALHIYNLPGRFVPRDGGGKKQPR